MTLTPLVCPVGIDNTASYFGDVHLMPGDIDNIVENVFDLGNGRTMTSLPLNCTYNHVVTLRRHFPFPKPLPRVFSLPNYSGDSSFTKQCLH